LRFTPFVLVALLWPGLFASAAVAQDEPVRYDGHKLVRAQIASARDFQRMLSLSAELWSEHVDFGPVDFRVRPEAMGALALSGLRYEVLIDDLQAVVDEERERLANPPPDAGWFDDFKDLDAIYAQMDALAALRPDLARTFVVGTSLEGRPIRGLRVSNDAFSTGRQKRGMVWNSTQHAREWIAPMVTMYIADALVTRYETDPAIHRLVDRVEFYFVPVLNVDGYVYTWGPDRFWRKNRRDNPNSSCFGVDLNRNWGYQWGLGPPGSSPDPCSDLFHGAAPFSEPETAALRDFILARPWVRYVHDMHSHGQLMLHAWGYTTAQAPGHHIHQWMGANMAALVYAVHGRIYEYGPGATTLYLVSGKLPDWAWGALQAYSFTFELRGPGFNPPPSEILPNGREILPAALWLADFVLHPMSVSGGSGGTGAKEAAGGSSFDSRNGLRER
jgi:carboxypeptidase A2/carboxypeptidase A1